MITPFRIAVDQTALDDLALRLRTFRQPPSPEDRGWEDGTDLDYLAELIAYWRDSYDWRAHEAALNRFGHFTTEIGDARLHFLHEKGRGPTPLPLLLAHGWPDGFQRFVKLIPLLTHGSESRLTVI